MNIISVWKITQQKKLRKMRRAMNLHFRCGISKIRLATFGMNSRETMRVRKFWNKRT